MRHSNRVKKLSRKRKVRKGLMRGLSRSLLLAGKITTTEAKAKALRPTVERLIGLGKRNTPAAQRLLYARLPDRKVVRLLSEKISPGYRDRRGGYTRISKIGRRRSDGARMAIIELV